MVRDGGKEVVRDRREGWRERESDGEDEENVSEGGTQ